MDRLISLKKNLNISAASCNNSMYDEYDTAVDESSLYASCIDTTLAGNNDTSLEDNSENVDAFVNSNIATIKKANISSDGNNTLLPSQTTSIFLNSTVENEIEKLEMINVPKSVVSNSNDDLIPTIDLCVNSLVFINSENIIENSSYLNISAKENEELNNTQYDNSENNLIATSELINTRIQHQQDEKLSNQIDKNDVNAINSKIHKNDINITADRNTTEIIANKDDKLCTKNSENSFHDSSEITKDSETIIHKEDIAPNENKENVSQNSDENKLSKIKPINSRYSMRKSVLPINLKFQQPPKQTQRQSLTFEFRKQSIKPSSSVPLVTRRLTRQTIVPQSLQKISEEGAGVKEMIPGIIFILFSY